jgi:hypothetical protein
LFSGKGYGDSTYFEGFLCIAGSDEVSGQLESVVGRDCKVEFSECFFDQGDPESPVSVERAIEIEDDALRWQRAITG